MKVIATVRNVSLLLLMIMTLGHVHAGVLNIKGEEATLEGIYIKDIRTGKVIMNHNSTLALTPASVMKSITVATVLDIYGDQWQFKTPVTLTGNAQTDNPAVWQGNLVIESSGDPTLESDNFKENKKFTDSIIDALKKLGISRIEGKVIIRETMKDAGPVTKWEIEDLAWPYGAALYGFNYFDNIFTLWPATGKSSPNIPGLKVSVIKSEDGNDLLRGIYSDNLVVFAKYPDNKKWSVASTMPNPAKVYQYLLTQRLRREGIQIDDRASQNNTGARKVIYTHKSVVANDIMKSLMYRSDNLFAEGMLRYLAPDKSRDEAIKILKDHWKNQGINSDYSYIFDGSGLTRANRLQPIFLAKVLEKMTKGQHGKTYTSFFPKAGMDGTMRSFLSKSPLKGKIAMKTGSVNGVQCYAGYKLDGDGNPTHVIVVMINGFFSTRAELKSAIEKLITNKLGK